jgi:hypothetical protein
MGQPGLSKAGSCLLGLILCHWAASDWWTSSRLARIIHRVGKAVNKPQIRGLPCLRQPTRSATMMRRQAATTISSPASLAASSTAQVICIRGVIDAIMQLFRRGDKFRCHVCAGGLNQRDQSSAIRFEHAIGHRSGLQCRARLALPPSAARTCRRLSTRQGEARAAAPFPPLPRDRPAPIDPRHCGRVSSRASSPPRAHPWSAG